MIDPHFDKVIVEDKRSLNILQEVEE